MFTYFLSSLLILHLTITNCSFICYHLIRLYSYFQMKLTKSKKKIADSKDSLDCLIGNCLVSGDSTAFNIDEINKSDFAVLVSGGTNMVCFYPPIDEYIPEYEMSDLQFISVKIEVNSLEYNIRLRTPHYTFYIVDNELNVSWVRYYFMKYLDTTLQEDVKYKMTIIDENVQFIMLNEKDSIVLEKNSYRLVLDEEVVEEADDLDVEDDEDDNDDTEEEQEENEADADELSLDKMLEIEEEIKAEQKQMEDDYILTKYIDDLEKEKEKEEEGK